MIWNYIFPDSFHLPDCKIKADLEVSREAGGEGTVVTIGWHVPGQISDNASLNIIITLGDTDTTPYPLTWINVT